MFAGRRCLAKLSSTAHVIDEPGVYAGVKTL
jgi:hypothetical protein